MHEKKRIVVISVSFCLAVLLAGGFAWWGYSCRLHAASRLAQARLAQRARAWDSLKYEVLAQIKDYRGEAALVIKDLRTNWEMSYNKDRRMPAASLAKIPVMISCLYARREGMVGLDNTMVLKNSFKTGGAGRLKAVSAGASISVGELMRLMICESDNTATNMLIEVLGEDFVNQCAGKFGLTRTVLERKMMDFTARKQGVENYTCASDMANALELIYGGRLIDEESSAFALGLLKGQKYNDRIPARLPTDATVAHKTGLERSVCHDVGIVFTPKGDFLICVLTSKDKASALSKAFISRVALLVYNYFQQF